MRVAALLAVGVGAVSLSGAPAAASPCDQEDVLDFVGSHLRADSLLPVSLAGTPAEIGPVGPHGVALCSSWLRVYDPASPAAGHGGTIWMRQDWSVRRLRSGYAVTLLPRPAGLR